MNKSIVTTIVAAGVLALSSAASADIVVSDLNSTAASTYTLGSNTPVEDQDGGSDNPWSGMSSVAFDSQIYGQGTSQADADHAWTLSPTSLLYTASGSTNTIYGFGGESNDIFLSSETFTVVDFTLSNDAAYSIQTTMNQQGPGETYGYLENADTGDVSEWDFAAEGGTFSDMGTLVAGDYTLYMMSTTFYQVFDETFSGSFQAESQYDLTFSVMIPLPAAGFMGLAGIGGLAFTRRRRDDV